MTCNGQKPSIGGVRVCSFFLAQHSTPTVTIAAVLIRVASLMQEHILTWPRMTLFRDDDVLVSSSGLGAQLQRRAGAIEATEPLAVPTGGFRLPASLRWSPVRKERPWMLQTMKGQQS
jgi:hypothetical protein